MAAEVNLAERYPSLSPSHSPPRPKPEPERVSGNVKELGKGRNRLLQEMEGGLQSEVVSPFFITPVLIQHQPCRFESEKVAIVPVFIFSPSCFPFLCDHQDEFTHLYLKEFPSLPTPQALQSFRPTSSRRANATKESRRLFSSLIPFPPSLCCSFCSAPPFLFVFLLLHLCLK